MKLKMLMKKVITVPAYTTQNITICDTDAVWQHEAVQVTIMILEHAHVTLHIELVCEQVKHLCVEIFLQGDYASFEGKGYYILRGTHRLSIATLQHHTGRNTTSLLVTKGLLYDTAVGAYEGMIHIAKDAVKTHATVRNKNILLSRKARMKSQPNIEVNCADVQCFHGSAIAPIDPQLVWYMSNRGLNEKQAKTVVLEAFLHDVRAQQ